MSIIGECWIRKRANLFSCCSLFLSPFVQKFFGEEYYDVEDEEKPEFEEEDMDGK